MNSDSDSAETPGHPILSWPALLGLSVLIFAAIASLVVAAIAIHEGRARSRAREFARNAEIQAAADSAKRELDALIDELNERILAVHLLYGLRPSTRRSMSGSNSVFAEWRSVELSSGDGTIAVILLFLGFDGTVIPAVQVRISFSWSRDDSVEYLLTQLQQVIELWGPGERILSNDPRKVETAADALEAEFLMRRWDRRQ